MTYTYFSHKLLFPHVTWQFTLFNSIKMEELYYNKGKLLIKMFSFCHENYTQLRFFNNREQHFLLAL